ncbi:MAG: GNAT family N-acetyltransferase [Candidatus Heimdallarchaeota archaeon]
MIEELPKSNYMYLWQLFESKNDHMAIKAIIDQSVGGKVWVDDIASPQTCCLWDQKNRLYLGGKADDGFRHSLSKLLTGEIAATAKKKDIDTFIVYFPPKSKTWEDHLRKNKIFSDLRKYKRSYYKFKELEILWKDKIPKDYSIRRIDKDLLENTTLRNRLAVIREIASMNPSIEEWLERGFGFSAIHDEANAIVCWCTAEYILKSRLECDFGIETAEEYQKQGFGTLTAAAAVDYGKSNGFQMGWDTWSDNEASQKLAEKVGFEKIADYSVYVGCFDPHLNALVNGYYALRVKNNYRESTEIYAQAFKLGESDAFHYFTAACAWTQLGKTETALRYLAKAVDKGWTDIAHDDLVPLHQSPGWEKITDLLS